jgi:hypothetical protein
MPMRRLCLILLAGLVAAPAAVAALRAPSDGVLELRKVNASSAVIVGQRGSLWGQMDYGRLTVTDPTIGDGQIYVTGADHAPHFVNENVTVYWGKDLHFRVTGGKYRLSFKGAGIDLTAVGVGTATLLGDFNADDAGDYSLDGGDKWLSVPFVTRTVTFGVQPPTPAVQ